MIETTYLISAASCIMVGVSCLTVGWLIGQHLTKSDRARLAVYAEHEQLCLHFEAQAAADRLRRESYLAEVQTKVDADAIHAGELCMQDECDCDAGDCQVADQNDAWVINGG